MAVDVAFYRILLGLYVLGVRIAARFQPKARQFLQGRKNGLETIRLRLAGEKRPVTWVHCASLGEFEQGRPIIEAIREQFPEVALLITFFSPSGYEVRKDYKGADYVFYLPVDSAENARQFLDMVRPELCIFVKYEFWYFYLSQIAARKIPVILVSAIFRERQGFFKWYGGLQRKMLGFFEQIFVQDTHSKYLLATINIQNVAVSGDTRFDRVIQVAARPADIPPTTQFAKKGKVLVAGSTWKSDEEFLYKAFSMLPDDWNMILVPHEVHSFHIEEIERLFSGNTERWSAGGNFRKRVLIVDTVGLLSQLYRYGTVAWIGGGFDKEGVHNVLEAAVYGIPCFFGPVFHQFMEAEELVARGGAFTVKQPGDLVKQILAKDRALENSGKIAKDYVYSAAGATARIMKYINTILKKQG